MSISTKHPARMPAGLLAIRTALSAIGDHVRYAAGVLPIMRAAETGATPDEIRAMMDALY